MYSDSHYKDTSGMTPSDLSNGISYAGKMLLLHCNDLIMMVRFVKV